MSDPETTRALGELSTAVQFVGDSVRDLGTKIDTVATEGREDSKKMGERLDAHAADTRNRLHDVRNDVQVAVMALERNVASLETGLAHHVQDDRRQFDRLEREISVSTSDRGKLWRMIAGMGGAGGVGAAIAKFFGAEP